MQRTIRKRTKRRKRAFSINLISIELITAYKIIIDGHTDVWPFILFKDARFYDRIRNSDKIVHSLLVIYR